MWDDRAPSFRQVGDVAVSVARSHCDVEVDDTTTVRWQELMALLREFDTLCDDTAISREAAMDELRHFENLAELYPSLALDTLPNEAREKLVRRVETILNLGEQAAKTMAIDEFINCRTKEAEHTARLLDDAATPYVIEQPAYEERFVPTIRSLSVVACALDSLTDARKDYAAGDMALQPGGEYYKACAKLALQEAGPGMAALAHKDIVAQFAVMSVNRLRNRIKRGVTEASSLGVLRSFLHSH